MRNPDLDLGGTYRSNDISTIFRYIRYKICHTKLVGTLQLKLVHTQHVWLAQGEGTKQHVVEILYERHAAVSCVTGWLAWLAGNKNGNRAASMDSMCWTQEEVLSPKTWKASVSSPFLRSMRPPTWKVWCE